jgi:hypothetical protein
MVPPVFAAYARVLPPSIDPHDERRHRWPEIAAQTGVELTAADLAHRARSRARRPTHREDARAAAGSPFVHQSQDGRLFSS